MVTPLKPAAGDRRRPYRRIVELLEKLHVAERGDLLHFREDLQCMCPHVFAIRDRAVTTSTGVGEPRLITSLTMSPGSNPISNNLALLGSPAATYRSSSSLFQPGDNFFRNLLAESLAQVGQGDRRCLVGQRTRSTAVVRPAHKQEHIVGRSVRARPGPRSPWRWPPCRWFPCRPGQDLHGGPTGQLNTATQEAPGSELQTGPNRPGETTQPPTWPPAHQQDQPTRGHISRARRSSGTGNLPDDPSNGGSTRSKSVA